MKYVTPQNGPEIGAMQRHGVGPSEDAERVLELAAVLDPAAFDDDVPKSKTQVAQIQWAARRHMAMESAGRAVAAGWVHHDEVKVAEARAELHHSNLLKHWDRADAAEAEVRQLKARPRAWFFAPGQWHRRYLPITFGHDQFHRRVLVLGIRWTGAVAIALWQLQDPPECADCGERRSGR